MSGRVSAFPRWATRGGEAVRQRAAHAAGESPLVHRREDASPVTKLVRYTGTNRYGGRDESRGGDDWAKPTVHTFIAVTLADGPSANAVIATTPSHTTHFHWEVID